MNFASPPRFHSAAIFVSDINRSKRFYVDILGQEIDLDLGQNIILKGGLTIWEIDPAHVIPRLMGIDAIVDETVHRFELYFETEDVPVACAGLEKSGVAFFHRLHEEPWGQRTIRFYDPDRHLIEIGETMEVFIRRLRDEGRTAEEASAKTGIPLPRVLKCFE
jgi:catechol 2,3-dioxygenase-like lactoylglutathione lyase family enzyme